MDTQRTDGYWGLPGRGMGAFGEKGGFSTEVLPT
ncbi:hypothetical protein Olsu_1418 [Olsenella uli DSM 7084]|uniref:Uncharacterized protein n=1 Tax=Olsenella uli (strain ATCC 49627 / DSM 7084 / CCUG 31166 / CIP 109912 / JCM 12494 / LMG 11480 / NCIMB 702895 / VPI D76D-27C) TaxID=633147 RepID=E1QWL8_OLSUV|nr:hypothetical protein Olsu_1418 [Olsenella uli DSM 7084]